MAKTRYLEGQHAHAHAHLAYHKQPFNLLTCPFSSLADLVLLHLSVLSFNPLDFKLPAPSLSS